MAGFEEHAAFGVAKQVEACWWVGSELFEWNHMLTK